MLSQAVFSNVINVSGSYKVNITIEEPRDVVYKPFALLCVVSYGAAPIPYVHQQEAILDLFYIPT